MDAPNLAPESLAPRPPFAPHLGRYARAPVRVAVPSVAQLLGSNFALQLAGMLSGQLLAFVAAARVGADSRWAALAAGAVGVAFAAARLVAMPAVGRLGDTHGHELLLALAAPLGVISATLAAVVAVRGRTDASGVGLLLAARVLEGLAAACATPTMLTLLARATEGRPALRTRVMGSWELSSLAGLVGALLFTGPLWERLHGWAVVVVAPIYLLAVPLLLRRARTLQSSAATAQSYAGAAVAMATRATTSDTPPLGRALRTLAARRDHRAFATAWIAVNAAVGLWLQYMPYLLVLGAHNRSQRLVGSLSGFGTSATFAVVGVLYVGGTAAWSFLASRCPRRLMLGVAVGSIVGMAVALVMLNHGAPRGWYLAVAVFTAAQGGITPAALSLLADLTADDDAARGTSMGVYTFLMGVGQLVGALIGGPIVARWQLDGLLAFSVALAGTALVALRLLARATGAAVHEPEK